jgi:hypothetical protein
MWILAPILVVLLVSFLVYLSATHPLRWVPFMLIFGPGWTAGFLDQEHVARGWLAVAIGCGIGIPSTGLLAWITLRGWVTWDGDGDAFP